MRNSKKLNPFYPRTSYMPKYIKLARPKEASPMQGKEAAYHMLKKSA